MVAMDRYKKRPLMKQLTTNKRKKKIGRYQRATAIQLTKSTSPVPQQIITNNNSNNSVQIAHCISVGKEEYVISESQRFSKLLSPTGMLTDNIIEAFMLANFLESPEDLFILPSKTATDILVHGRHFGSYLYQTHMKSITDANTEIENDLKLRAIIPVLKNCSKKFRTIKNSHKLLKTPRSIRLFF
jgi:hypothetical protein